MSACGDTPLHAPRALYSGTSMPPTHAPASDDQLTNSRGDWHRSLWLHAVLLGVLLCALVPIVDNGTPAAVDEGVYAAQAANLSKGNWAGPRPLPRLDPDGHRGALIDSVIVGDQWIPYARQPLYPVLLTPWYRFGGYRGMLILSIIGTLGAAVAAAAIGRIIDHRFALPSLWITGIGTPLLFDAYVVLGHSIAAAAAGLVGYSLLRAWGFHPDGVARSASPRWWLVCVLGTVMLVMLRSEGAVVAGAVSVVGVALSISGLPHHPRLRWGTLVPAISVGLTGVAAYLLNARWTSVIIGQAFGGAGSVRRETDPLAQVWISILRPWGIDNRYASAATALLVICSIGAALCLRLLPRRPSLAVGLLLMATLGAVAHNLERQELISGLFATIPIVVIGLILIPRLTLADFPIRFLLGSVALSTTTIVWTSYGTGGTAEWGGRFYHVLIPFLVPASVAGLHHGLSMLPVRLRPISIVAAITMTSLVSLSALRTMADYKSFDQSEVTAVTHYRQQVGLEMPVVFATVQSSGLTRLFWRDLIDAAPIVNGGNIGGLNQMLPTADRIGIDELMVITDVDRFTFEYVLNKARELSPAATDNWTVISEQTLDETGLTALRLQRRG